MKSSTLTLVRALEILSLEIESGDGVANTAIAEAAERLHALDIENHKLSVKLADAERALEINHERAERIIKAREGKSERVSIALRDAISTFRDDDKTTLVSAERQEAWIDALNS